MSVVVTSDHDDGCVRCLRGIGGVLMLYADRVRILREGSWFTAANLLFHMEREMDTVITLRELVGVHFVRSLMLVQFMRLTYPGCPASTGRYLHDAFAENAFIYSLVDNRPLLDFMHEISRTASAIGQAPGAGAGLACH
jgi:hypothetical protein